MQRQFLLASVLTVLTVPCLSAADSPDQAERQKFVGVYTLEGDTLKWCVSPQKVRPQTFETKKGQFLLILKRQKP